MLIRLSWRNIWRNKVRSGVILTAITLGLFAGTYLVSFMTGWMTDAANTEIANHHAHIQIHHKQFVANSDINAFFERDAVEDALSKSDFADRIKVSYRLSINGLLASAANVTGISIKAVHLDEEESVSNIWKSIPDSLGRFLPDEGRMPVVISQKTAEHLKVRLGSKIVLTFADGEGEMKSLAFRVSGVYHTPSPQLDQGKAFVRHQDLYPETALPPNAVHEAAITVKDIETCATLYPQVTTLLPHLDVKDWRTLTPMLSISLDYMKYVVFVYIGIFLFALSFGIINTMLMAVLDRTRELIMLRAIGMEKRKIFHMIMLETAFLTMLGSFAGIALAALVITPATRSGIDMTPFIGDSFKEYGMSSVVYPVLKVGMVVQIVVLVAGAAVLSALYPAKKALKIKSNVN